MHTYIYTYTDRYNYTYIFKGYIKNEYTNIYIHQLNTKYIKMKTNHCFSTSVQPWQLFGLQLWQPSSLARGPLWRMPYASLSAIILLLARVAEKIGTMERARAREGSRVRERERGSLRAREVNSAKGKGPCFSLRPASCVCRRALTRVPSRGS